MTRTLRKLVKWFYFLIALALILLAVLVQSGRSFSHLLGDYNLSIASYLSTQLNAQVAIGKIEADWSGLKPSLVVKNFSINSNTNEPIVAFKQARLRLDILESLLNFRLVWSNLVLNQVDMTFAQTAEGFWQIPGLPKRVEPNKPQAARLDALVDMLLLSTRIEFQSSHLGFNFASGQQVRLDSPYLLLENTDDFHRLSLQIDVDEQPRSAYLVMEGQGDPRNQQMFRSRGYVQLNRFPTSEPVAAASAFLLGGVGKAHIQSEGRVDANIWFESRAQDDGYDLVGRLGLQRLSLPIGKQRLSLDDFATELTGYWKSDGAWRLGLQQVSATMKAQQISDVNLALASSGFKQPLQINMDKLDVVRLCNMLVDSGALGQGKLQEVLVALAPQGQLRNLQVTLPIQTPKDWQLRANLDAVAVSAWHGVPALQGVTGYVEANQKGGFIDIDSRQHFSMHYSPLYAEPMEYDLAKGRVAWYLQPENNQIFVNSGLLELQKGDELARGYMWLSLPWQRNTGDIDLYLQVGGRQLNASLYKKYTPAALPASLLSWLEQSIGANNTGVASEVGFVYRGTLNTKNPMARTYQLYLDVEDAELNYHPGWPALTQLDGRILISDAHVSASVTKAGILASRIKRAEVRVAPLPDGKGSILQVKGDLEGVASDGVRVLREGMLRQYIGSSMDSWAMQGDMQASLDLTIPLGKGGLTAGGGHQQVDVELQVPRFDMQNLNLTLNDLNGHITYNSDKGISSNTLEAQFFDEPVAIKLSTQKQKVDSKTLVDVSGTVDVRKLAYWSKRPELLFLSGNMPYQAQVVLNHRSRSGGNLVELNPTDKLSEQIAAAQFSDSAFAAVSISSNLAGVAIDLPPPYGKKQQEERPLDFTLWLQDAEAQIDVRYNSDVHGLLRTNRNQENQLLNANIALASEAHLSEQPEFLVSGFLPAIDLDAWKAVLARYKTYTDQLAPVIVQGLHQKTSTAPAASSYGGDVQVGLVAGLPFRAELMLGQYELGSLTLENLNVIALPVREGWQLQVDNAMVAGKLLVPDSSFVPLQVELEYLSLNKEILGLADEGPAVSSDASPASNNPVAGTTVSPIEVIDPRTLPLANISIGSLMMDNNNYGNWSLQLRPNTMGVVIDNIRGSIRGVTVSGLEGKQSGAQIIWQYTPAGVQTRFMGNLSAGDMAAVLRAWEKPDTIESAAAEYRTDLFWPGSPQDFALANLGGEMSIAMEAGRFKRDASAGDGILRLMSILNFDTLARRLRFDFSDLYKGGLAYDTINGKVRFNQGIMVFEEPLIVRTPSSGMQMAGSIDLRNETINTRLVATLPVAGNVTFYAALATGLPAAAGIYLVSKLFKKQVDQATSVSYSIKGSWNEPKIRFDRLFESEKSLRDSVDKKEDDEAEASANK
jgi:uncharacterized protein YhdP